MSHPPIRYRVATLFLALTLLPCPSATSKEGFFGFGSTPYGWQRGPGKLITVRFVSGRTTMHRAALLTLHHCALIASHAGKPYFALYRDLPDALADRRSAEPMVTTILHQPSAITYILLQDGPGPGLLSTAKVLSELTPQLNRAAP